jgi:hypothetical protein
MTQVLQHMALLGNEEANKAQWHQYSEADVNVICDAADKLQSVVASFKISDDAPEGIMKCRKRLWEVARILRGRIVRFPNEGNPLFLSPLQAAAYLIQNDKNDMCHRAIASIMYSFESLPNLWAFMQHCVIRNFILTIEALLFDYQLPVYATALWDLLEDGTFKHLQLAIRMIQDPRMRQGLNLLSPDGDTVLHAFCRVTASASIDPKPGEIQRLCEMARLLLDYGVSPRQTNMYGETPVQLLIPQQMPLTAQPPPPAADAITRAEYIKGLRYLHRLLAP